jgi:hypothetical protein
MNRFFGLTALLAGAIVASSCGPTKEEAALNRIEELKKRKPGYARVVNLGSDTVKLTQNGRTFGSNIGPGGASGPGSIGAGEKVFRIDGANTDIEITITIEDNKNTTILLLEDGSTAVYGGENRVSGGGNNLQFFFVAEDGSLLTDASVTGELNGVSMTFESGGSDNIAVGDVTVGGDSLSGETSGKIGEKFAYSLLFVQDGDSFKPYFLTNSDVSQPAAGAPSAA